MRVALHRVLIGMLLKAYRKNVGLTQVRIAHHIGVSPSHYSLLEAGKQIPSTKTLYSISVALQLDSVTSKQLSSLVATAKGLKEEDGGAGEGGEKFFKIFPLLSPHLTI